MGKAREFKFDLQIDRQAYKPKMQNYRVTRIIVDDFECKNKYLRFFSKLCICYCHVRDFIKILCTQFHRCRLLIYFVTVDLVTSPKITAMLHLSAYVIVHGKVIRMEHLNESQLRAQAVRLIEENN